MPIPTCAGCLTPLGAEPLEALSVEKARGQATPADAALEVLRGRKMQKLADLGIVTEDITIPGAAGPLPARIYRPDTKRHSHPIIAYWHGGGWVIADIDAYDASCRATAQFADCIVVSCHYRQAPEAPFPAAHQDALAAYRWVVDNCAALGGERNRIAVMGEGAGANLALNVAIAARDQGLRAPCHMALICPIAGADMNTESYLENEAARPLSGRDMAWFAQHVFSERSQTGDPRINLVAADLHGLPSATIVRAEIDPLRTEGEILERRLEDAGSEVRARTFNGVTHEFFGMGLVVKQAAAAETFVAHELKRAFGTPMLPI